MNLQEQTTVCGFAQGETVTECLEVWANVPDMELKPYGECAQCASLPFKIVVIQGGTGQKRGVLVCGRHFVEVCKACHLRNNCKLVHPARMLH
jgi:hypothetical protein